MNERTPLRRRVAKAVVRHQYDSIVSESAPFLRHAGEQNSEQEEEERKKRRGLFGCGPSLSDAIALVSVVSSVVTAFFTNLYFVNLTSALNSAFGVYCMYQNRVLSKLPSIREVYNGLREQTNQLRGENARLNRSVYRLDRSVARVEALEEELAVLAGDASNVRRLVEIADEQRKIHREMEKKLKAEVFQIIVGAVIRSDRNRDFQLSPIEMESLIVRLGLINGVEFDEKRFRQELGIYPNHSLGAIMSILRNLLRDGHSEGNAIFNLQLDQLSSTSVSAS